MRIFHVALAREWEQARRDGAYTTSTLGVTLEQEGYIHASREDQWRGVLERYYGDVAEPLVLLVIDTDHLTAPVVEETPPGASETFPHVYGPINADAVVEARPLGRSFSALFLQEVFRSVVAALVVLVAAVVGAVLLDQALGGWGRLVGALLGGGLAVLAVREWVRRRR